MDLRHPVAAAQGYSGGDISWVSPTTYVHACGNSIQFCSVGEDAQESRPMWGQGNSIGAVTACARRGVLLYAERLKELEDPRVFVYDVEGEEMINVLKCENELGIVALALCRDEPWVAVLGDVPEHAVMLWNFEEGTLLARASARSSRATMISFDPLNPNTIASTGTKLELWELVSSENGEVFLLADPVGNLDQDDRDFTAHCWAPGNSLFLGSDTGEVLHVNARTGKKMPNSAWVKVFEEPVGALAVTLKHVIVGGATGELACLLLNGHTVDLQVQLVDGPIASLALNPSFDCMVMGTSDGSVFSCAIPEAMLHAAPDWSKNVNLRVNVGSRSPDGPLCGLAVLANSPVAITVGRWGSLSAWRLPSLSLVQSTVVGSGGDPPTCLAVDEDARVAAVGTSDGALAVYDLSDLSNHRLVFLSRLHESKVTTVRVAHPIIASAAEDGTLCISLILPNMVRPVARGTLAGLLDFNLLPGMLIASTTDKLIHRIPLPSPDELLNWKAGVPLPLSGETAPLPSAANAFRIGTSEDATKGWLVAICRDRATRAFSMTLAKGAFALVASGEDNSAMTLGTAIATDDAGGKVLTGCYDGTIALRARSALASAQKPHRRHRGFANLGVTVAAMGRGALEGWFITGGADGSLMVQSEKKKAAAPNVAGDPPILEGELAEVDTVDVDLSPLDVHSEKRRLGGATPAEGTVWDTIADASREAHGSAREYTSEASTSLLSQQQSLKIEFAEILEYNRNCDPLEKLERDELVIDVAMRDRMVAQGDAAAEKVREQILNANLRTDLTSHLIRERCYDTMEEQAAVLMPLGESPLGGVSGYPLPKVGEVELRGLQMVRIQRKIEMAELKDKAEQGSVAATDGMLMSEEDFVTRHGGKAAAAEVPVEEEADVKKISGDVMALQYHDMELTTRERRLNQVALMRESVRVRKAEMNKAILAAIAYKSREIDRLDEKAARVAEILTELESEEAVERYLLSGVEEGTQLQVKDEDMTEEKYVSAKERAALEQAAREEQARKANSDKDDQAGRALQDMMNGSLEAKKEAVGVEVLKKPSFMDEPLETLSEEQVKQVKEFEKRLKAVEEAQDQHRKGLEAEVKKIKGEIGLVVEAFNAKVGDMAQDKLGCDGDVYELELKIALLLDSVVKEDDSHYQIQRLTKQVEVAQLDYDGATAALDDMKAELEEFREGYETLLNDDKGIERAFKKEVAESPYLEELTKLFKRRRYAGADKHAADAAKNLDPFAPAPGEGGPGAEGALPRPEPLDLDTDLPEGCSDEIADRLVELRESKITMELEVKQKATQLMQLNRRLAELSENQSEASVQLDHARDELSRLQQERVMDTCDIIMFRKVKQGQVEVEGQENEMLHDGGTGALIEVDTVHQLNRVVRSLGKEKFDLMEETKSFRNKIHAVNWENQMLQLKATDVAENIRYFQLLWVTKDLQVAIKGGQDDRKTAQNVTLEKQMGHCKEMQENKVEDMKQRLFKAHKQIRSKELENEKLGEYVQDLAVSVAQREKILRVRQSGPDAVDESEYKMQEVIWRRLVLEEARQQSEDISILKAEVDRLRQRTFPSFARNYAAQMGR